MDPLTGEPSSMPADGTSSPMVAPDGRVFSGVLGTPFGTNASRGWMLQFDSLLVSAGPPGAFGWDITPSLVPPGAVMEWCINTTAVDPWSHSVLAGSEDGRLYRWDLGANTCPESIQLNPELGQACTPSLIGPDGQVCTIHNATLLAIGASTVGAPPNRAPDSFALALAGANPCRGEARLRCSRPASGRATLDVLDVAGRHERRRGTARRRQASASCAGTVVMTAAGHLPRGSTSRGCGRRAARA